jgi:hypothetical protein
MKKIKQSNIPTTAIAVIITAIVVGGAILTWHYNQIQNLASAPAIPQKPLPTSAPKQAPKITAVQTKEEELDGPTEDAAGASPLPFTYNTSTVFVQIVRDPISELYTAETLAAMSEECGTNKTEAYFKTLLSKFSTTDKAVTYKFFAHGANVKTDGPWTVTVLPNKLGYTNLTDFRKDFDLCAAGNNYPSQVSAKYLLLTGSCGGAATKQNVNCEKVQKSIEPSLKLR